MTTLESDLRSRWRPSDAAIGMAAATFAAHPDAELVLTGHFLVGKEYGWWTDDIVVEHAATAYPTVNEYVEYNEARNAAELDAALIAGERPGTLGYTVHNPDGTWSVFEEILDILTVLRLAREDGKL